MKRIAISLSEAADAEHGISQLRSRLSTADGAQSPLEQAAEKVIRDLAQQGATLSAMGSAFSASRTMADDACEIQITASFGQKPSLLQRLFRRK